MSTLHYELTDETTTNIYGTVLHRIRATRDLPKHGVREGDLGGWIESEKNLSGDAWVFGDAWVYGDARVYGYARVFGDARVLDGACVYGYARVLDGARVYGYAHVFGDAWVFGDARVYGYARVFGDARVYGYAHVSGDAWVYGDARVYGNASVSRPEHVLTVSPIGSEQNTATLHRTTTGHALHVGCWKHGTLDTLMGEVERRAENWNAPDHTKTAWRAQYDALHALATATIALWETEE